jgi:hypothetical protein
MRRAIQRRVSLRKVSGLYVLGHLAEFAHVEPPIAHRASHEMIGLCLGCAVRVDAASRGKKEAERSHRLSEF